MDRSGFPSAVAETFTQFCCQYLLDFGSRAINGAQQIRDALVLLAIETVSDPVGLVVTSATLGNVDAGDKVATAVGLLTGAKDLTKLGKMTNLQKVVTVVNAAQSANSA